MHLEPSPAKKIKKGCFRLPMASEAAPGRRKSWTPYPELHRLKVARNVRKTCVKKLKATQRDEARQMNRRRYVHNVCLFRGIPRAKKDKKRHCLKKGSSTCSNALVTSLMQWRWQILMSTQSTLNEIYQAGRNWKRKCNAWQLMFAAIWRNDQLNMSPRVRCSMKAADKFDNS